MSSSVSTYNYTAFDELGRIKGANQVTGGQTYAFTLDYYPFMGAKDITYPGSNRTLTTGYDTGGRPNSLSGQIGTNPAIPYVTQVTYAPQGAIGSLALNNGLSESWQYNARLQPTQIQLGTLFTIINRYDPSAGVDVDCNGNVISPAISGNNGNVLAQTLNGVVRSYSYDGVNRICRAFQGATWTQGYAYDARGNVAFPLWTGQLPNATADVSGSVSAYGANNQVAAWAYDGAGNVTGIPAAGGSTARAACASTVMPGVAMMRTACYDAENRMTSETDANGNTATYAYDGDGRRISKTVNAVTTAMVYDPQGQLAQEYGGAPIPAPETGTRYLTADHLGSTRVMTNVNGAVTQTYDYLPFGEEFVQSGDTNRVRFTGKERDAETGLDYFEARYYSSAEGRFTSPDEFKGGFLDAFSGKAAFQPGALPYADLTDPQTLNKYAYVRNNPLRYTDPNGHCAEDLCIVEGAAVGTGVLYAGAAIAGAVGLTGVAVTLHNTGDSIISGAKSLVNSISSIFTSDTKATSQPKDVYIDPNKYPAAAGHAEEAQKAGQPDVLTVDRPGARGRRAQATAGTPTEAGNDRDEYPPAVTAEGGRDASTRTIPSSDNRGAGASVGNQIRDVPNGGQIRIIPKPKPDEP